MTTNFVVRIPTLKERKADDWDVLCRRLFFADRRVRKLIEQEIFTKSKELGLDPSFELDMAWSHARNMGKFCHSV